MTQHTETATPRTDEARFTTSYDTDADEYVHANFARQLERELAALQAKLETARLELSAERDAVAQYIGERNELQGKLTDLRQQYDDTVTRANAAEIRELELRTQLAQTEKTRDGWLIESQEWRAKYHLERDKLAQAQNEALERAAQEIDKKAEGYKNRTWYTVKLMAALVRDLKSPNSAEGEPG